MTKLNLGGCSVWSRDGWENLDISFGHDLRERCLYKFADDSVDLIFTSHCIEHMEFHEVARLMEDVYRALRPGGVIRIVVPDADILMDILRTKDMRYLSERCSCYQEGTVPQHVESLFGWDHFRRPDDNDVMHQSFFSWSTLGSLLHFVGFSSVSRRKHGESMVDELREEATLNEGGWTTNGFDNPMSSYMSLYVEAQK